MKQQPSGDVEAVKHKFPQIALIPLSYIQMETERNETPSFSPANFAVE